MNDNLDDLYREFNDEDNILFIYKIKLDKN